MIAFDSATVSASTSTEPKTTTPAITTTTRQMPSKNAPLRRRRFAGGSATSNSAPPESRPESQSSLTSPASRSPAESNALTPYGNDAPEKCDPVGIVAGNNSINVNGSSETNNNLLGDPPPPSSTAATSASSISGSKPCHAARLVLLSVQNASRMGARTQLGLCPPGRVRRELKAALRQRTSHSSRLAAAARRSSAGSQLNSSSGDLGGYFGVDKMVGPDVLDVYSADEEDFLVKNNTFDADSDEEASSGDDDDLTEMAYLLNEELPVLDDEKKYANLLEPLFTPIGAESSQQGAGAMSMGGIGVGKLPFNRRKLRYFDSISAYDTTAARAYLQQELQRSKKREVLLLTKHLKRTQRQQRRQMKEERGVALDENDYSDPESDDATTSRSLMPSSVAKFEHNMTPSMAASLVIESLEMNCLESIEGMAKCYDGIVAAGVALLEINLSDPTTPATEPTAPHATRSQIMAALAPLLITSLEQPSGDVIVSLAKLRRMCGTPRYQRRFVQRVAPALIRPPGGAMWCLRHQNDMEPILAAAELIFDSAFEIFSKGWYDRGQLLLADTKRAETLNTAAMQLKNLSSNSHQDMLTLDLGHNNWRSKKKDPTKGAKEPLAEWEVIAVDRQIRVSITNIISMDWSKVIVHSREAALSASSSYHRSRQAGKRPNALLQATSSGDMSPKSISSSQLSPLRPGARSQHAPPSVGGDNGELSNFPAHSIPPFDAPRARSPVPTTTTTMPLSPPPPNRSGGEDFENRLPSSSNLFPPSDHTPPRSPVPKHKDISIDAPASIPPASASGLTSPLSPKRSKSPANTYATKESIQSGADSVSSSPGTPQFGGDKDRAPLSPASPVGTPSETNVPNRPMSSASSVASSITGMTGVGAQPSHYRMLTSTAAERKRTVAACRALRAQITRFEEAFMQLHGRPPKGAAERAPLATTYAQYREWKRAIRADAACRIQALFRGARTRWMLLRSNDPDMSKVVLAGAGRRSSAAQDSDSSQPAGQDSILSKLSIPKEIGEPRLDSGQTTPTSGSESFPSPGEASNQTLTPQWGGQGGSRRRSGNSGESFTSGSPAPRPVPTAASSPGSRASVSLSELQARKRDLKQQLKQYDMNFARRHGRMPVKSEKEPIRHLYERYNALKSQITMMEQDGRQSSSPSSTQPLTSSSSAMLSQRTAVSPVGSDSEESVPMRPRSSSSQRPAPSASSSAAGAPTQENLAALKAEKGRLHQMLRSYEKDFFKEHQRQVSSFADIRPVASQYRRYKEIKKAITAVQQSENR